MKNMLNIKKGTRKTKMPTKSKKDLKIRVNNNRVVNLKYFEREIGKKSNLKQIKKTKTKNKTNNSDQIYKGQLKTQTWKKIIMNKSH